MAIFKRAQIKSMDLIDVQPLAETDAEKSIFYKTLLDHEMRTIISSLFSEDIRKHYEIVGVTPPDAAHGEPDWIVELENIGGELTPIVHKFAQLLDFDVRESAADYFNKVSSEELKGQDIRVDYVSPLMMRKTGSGHRWVCKIYAFKKNE